MKNNGLEIVSIGSYVPENVMTNADFEKIVDTSHQWIVERTGIHERRIARDEDCIDLGYNAAIDAITDKIDTSKIGVIIVATMTPTRNTPSSACMIQKRLGLENQQVMAFDINSACSGFVYALEIARSLLQNMPEDIHALVIGSEVLSKLLDFNDRTTCVLFGDGAGAVVCKKSDQIFYSYQDASGDKDVLYTDENNYLQMRGTDVFKFAIRTIPKSINNVLEQSGLQLDDIDYFVCHQANERIISHVYKKMKVDASKFYMNLQTLGNTSAASIPLALAQMNQEGLLKKGNKIICVGFGAGLTWGATLFEW